MSQNDAPRRLLSRQDFLRLSGATIFGTGLLMTGACGGGGKISGGGGDGSVFTLGRGGDSVTLDPAHSTDSESSMVCIQVFETLLEFKPGSTEVGPGLAEAVPEPEEGGRVYTFELREGVNFHDGAPCDAEAVVFNVERWRDTKSPYHKGGGKQASQFARYEIEFGGFDDDSNIEKVEAVNSRTVRFTLKEPQGTFLNDIAIYTFGIGSPKALKKDVEGFWQKPIGTGPFKFESWERSSKITLVKNDEWWGKDEPAAEGGGGPFVEKFVYRTIPDNTSRVAALTGGNLTGAHGLTPDDIDAISKAKEVRPYYQPSLNVGYLAMNNGRKPFDDPRVRRAVVHGIDMAKIVETFFGDSGELASNPMPRIVPGFAEDIKPFEHDPTLAKKLLGQAGLGKGLKAKLWYMPIPRPYLPNGKGVAQAMQADLEKVGIEVELVTREWATYIEETGKGEHDMCLLGWSGANGDPDTFLNVLLNSAYATIGNAQNVAYYKNSKVDDLLGQAQRENSMDKRAQLYGEVQRLFHEDAPWAPIAYAKPIMGMQKSVKGFKPAPAGQRYNTVRM